MLPQSIKGELSVLPLCHVYKIAISSFRSGFSESTDLGIKVDASLEISLSLKKMNGKF